MIVCCIGAVTKVNKTKIYGEVGPHKFFYNSKKESSPGRHGRVLVNKSRLFPNSIG